MRKDGRQNDQIRPVKVQMGFLEFAEGSCLFEIGKTKVICAASVEESVPPFLKGKGRGWITSEYALLPRACQQRVIREASKGKKMGRTHEIQRLIGRALRNVVDLKSLGERTIWIDCDVMQADGGTRCASITGSFIALCAALNWMKGKGMIPEIDIRHHVAAISTGIVKGEILLDLDYGEDSSAEVDMNIVMTGCGELIEIQGTAEKNPFSTVQMGSMMEHAQKGVEELINIQKSALEGVI
jgi:ribonuclease PH